MLAYCGVCGYAGQWVRIILSNNNTTTTATATETTTATATATLAITRMDDMSKKGVSSSSSSRMLDVG